MFQGQEELLGKHQIMSLPTGWTREELQSDRVSHKALVDHMPIPPPHVRKKSKKGVQKSWLVQNGSQAHK